MKNLSIPADTSPVDGLSRLHPRQHSEKKSENLKIAHFHEAAVF